MYYVFWNPASTQAAYGKRRIAELKRLVGKARVVVIESLPGGFEPNKKLLEEYHSRLQEGAVLCVAAGDGTINLVATILLSSTKLSAALHEVPLLPLWGGNANDLANMLNGPERTPLENVLQRAEFIRVHPLSCLLEYPDGKKEERFAICYASFGATAYAAAHLNTPRHRRNPLHTIPGYRFISSALAGLNGLLEAPLFIISEGGERKTIYERTFINGSRFAKLNLMSVRLNERTFHMRTLRHKRAGRLASHMWLLGLLHKNSRRLHRPVAFRCEQAVLAQLDGEVVELPRGTHVTVRISDRSFRALSTRLRGNYE